MALSLFLYGPIKSETYSKNILLILTYNDDDALGMTSECPQYIFLFFSSHCCVFWIKLNARHSNARFSKQCKAQFLAVDTEICPISQF